jgi:hypothetical protein
MELEVLKYLAEGGAGLAAIVIVIVFLFYRSDNLKRDKGWQEHCDATTAMFKEILADKRELILADQETREAHIKALNELTLYLKTMNGKLTDIAAWEGVKYGRRKEDVKEGSDGH